MRKILVLLCVLLSFALISCEKKITPLDKIHEYTITVEPNNDGTLNMVYYLKWEVLEEGDGGVDFITVGVANRFVRNIVGLTNNIKKIYYSSKDGATIHIDFNKTYHKGDIFEVKFSFRQERIFTLKNDEVQYSFNPGWFNEIEVEKLVVLWDCDRVTNSNANSLEYGYYRWETSLGYGETIDVNLVYNRSAFPYLNPKNDYSKQIENPLVYIGVFTILFVIIFLVTFIPRKIKDRYQRCRGFYGHVERRHFFYGRHYGYRRSGKAIVPSKIINGGGSGVSGGGCACACACACAGGGRAGCSRKDFNNYLEI